MDTSYIYAGTRAKTLEQGLLTETQVERLLSAKSVSEVYSVLQDTFLALHLSKKDADGIIDALDNYIVEAKQALESMSPNKEVLDILWLKYDYHNLKTIIKGKKLGYSNEQIHDLCFCGGKYKIDKMILAFENGTLSRLNNHFALAVEKARSATYVFEIDLAINKFYFKTIRNIELESKDKFVKEFVTVLIDLFNIKAALRIEILNNIDMKDIYVVGGSLALKDLEKRKDILNCLSRVGGDKNWLDAIALFEKSEDYTHIEKMSDEYIINFLRAKSSQTFSSAPLFSYFSILKSNAQAIGAVIVAKRSGVSEKELRTILRKVYA